MSTKSFVQNVNLVADNYDMLEELNTNLPKENVETLLSYDYTALLADLNSAESAVKDVSANMSSVKNVSDNMENIVNANLAVEQAVGARDEAYLARDEALAAQNAAKISADAAKNSAVEVEEIKTSIDVDYEAVNERIDNTNLTVVAQKEKLDKFDDVSLGGANQVLTITTNLEGEKIASWENPTGGGGSGGVSTPASSTELGLVIVPLDSDIVVDVDGNIDLTEVMKDKIEKNSTDIDALDVKISATDTKVANQAIAIDNINTSIGGINTDLENTNLSVGTNATNIENLTNDKADKTELNTFDAEQFTLTGTAVSINVWTGTQAEYNALPNKAEIFLAMITE